MEKLYLINWIHLNIVPVSKKVIFISLLMIMTTMSFLLLGCNRNSVANRFIKEVAITDPSLAQAINEYYSLEKEELWDKAYEFRTPNFKQSVPKNFYIAQMKKDNSGWRLVDFKIISVKMTKHNNEAIVKIRFKEKLLAGQYYGFPNYTVMDEETRWKKLNENWLCVSCGVRNHLNLNAEIVLE